MHSFYNKIIVVVHLLSCAQSFVTPWTAACQAPPLSPSVLRFMSVESVMLPNCLILCRPLLCLQSFPASGSFPHAIQSPVSLKTLLTYDSEKYNNSVFYQRCSTLFFSFYSYLYTNHLYLFDLL